MSAEELTLNSDAAQPSTREEPKGGTDWWGEAKSIFWLILAVLAIHSFVAKPFYIPSESMLPTLRVGDRLVVTKYPYGYSYVSPTFHFLPEMRGRLFGRLPERGDVVIATPPGSRTDFIKRVIGLPGDTIELRGGTVFLNGAAVPREAMGDRLIPVDANTTCDPLYYPGARVTGSDGRPYCRMAIFRETLPGGVRYDTVDIQYSRGDDFAEITVPEGHVFLMGDNRDNSADSRFSTVERGLGGPVPWESLGGRAEFITFSLDGTASLNPLSWWGSLRGGRTGASLHPERVE
ncbi:signal peptidase I [Sphingomonas sp.]